MSPAEGKNPLRAVERLVRAAASLISPCEIVCGEEYPLRRKGWTVICKKKIKNLTPPALQNMGGDMELRSTVVSLRVMRAVLRVDRRLAEGISDESARVGRNLKCLLSSQEILHLDVDYAELQHLACLNMVVVGTCR